MTTCIARLDSRALIRVSGPDARPFLHNLLTQDVETLAEGDLRFGALLSPPGRLLFDLFLRGETDAVPSRLKRRGSIKSRMLPIAFDGPPPPSGAEVPNGDLRAGEVLSGHDGAAMALLRLDRLEGALTVEGRPVTVRRPTWMDPS